MNIANDTPLDDRFVPIVADHRTCNVIPPIPNFFCLEGIDGVGKSTTCQEIVHILEQKNIPVYSHKEPGGSALGKLALAELYHDGSSSLAQAMTFIGIMSYHWDAIVKSRLDLDIIVLSDRHFPSVLVYHQNCKYFDQIKNALFSLCDHCGGLPSVVVLDSDPKCAATRAGLPTDTASIDRLARLRHGYRRLAHAYGWLVLSADASSPEENSERIVRMILNNE